MFKGTQPNPYDDIVGMSIGPKYSFLPTRLIHSQRTGKATDETLTSENWELILNLCDKVQDEGEQG
jgi:hypothetical protein